MNLINTLLRLVLLQALLWPAGIVSAQAQPDLETHYVRHELPIAHACAITPRFPNTLEVFGQKVNLARFDMHERYEREITNMCYMHNNTLLTIKRANRYFPIIVPILKEEGVPADFIYLACIESSLNHRAYSPAGAAGIWQFMRETGKSYGLTINGEVDERYHIEKATRAACRYFKEAYEKFGCWFTVAASYNAGQNGISRRLATQQANTALDLLVVEETSRYMFRIMAMKEILRQPSQYGFMLYSDQLYRPIRTRNITVRTGISNIASFAKKHNLSYFHLKEFNPWLRDNTLTNPQGRTYRILIPFAEDMTYNGQPFPIYDKAWVIDRAE